MQRARAGPFCCSKTKAPALPAPSLEKTASASSLLNHRYRRRPVTRLRRAHLIDDDRALEARVRRELAERLLERADDDLRARLLVALERLDRRLGSRARVQERDPAARHDALLERRARGLERVL